MSAKPKRGSKRGRGRRKAIIISTVWIGISALVLALAATLLFQGCTPGDCLVERTMIVWITAFTAPFTLAGLGIHLFVVTILPRLEVGGSEDHSE